MLPDMHDPELKSFVTNWSAGKAQNPRYRDGGLMVDRQQFLIRARVETHVLEGWIAEEWLIPRREAGREEFSDADVARAADPRFEVRHRRK